MSTLLRRPVYVVILCLVCWLVVFMAGCGGVGRGTGSTAGSSTSAVFLYAHTSAGIVGFLVNRDGSLTNLSTTAAAGTRLVSDGRAFLFSADNSSIQAFRVDPNSGALTVGNTVQQAATTDIAASADGRNVYATELAATGTIGGYANNNASLTALPGSPFSTREGSVLIRLSGDGSLAFSPFAFLANAGVGIYRRNSDGTLSLANTVATPTLTDAGPLALYTLAVSPTGNLIAGHVVLGRGETGIVVLSVDPATANTTIVPGSPFSTNDDANDLRFDPTGNFLLTTNGGFLRVLRVSSTGALTTVATPVALNGSGFSKLAIDNSGTVYVTIGANGTIAAFRLDSSTGTLTPVAGSPFAAGAGVTDVAIVRP